MSTIDQLKDRYETVMNSFAQSEEREAEQSEKLLGAITEIGEWLANQRQQTQDQKRKIERLTEENEEMRFMLHSLLVAIESKNRSRLSKTMIELENRLSALSKATPLQIEPAAASDQPADAFGPEQVAEGDGDGDTAFATDPDARDALMMRSTEADLSIAQPDPDAPDFGAPDPDTVGTQAGPREDEDMAEWVMVDDDGDAAASLTVSPPPFREDPGDLDIPETPPQPAGASSVGGGAEGQAPFGEDPESDIVKPPPFPYPDPDAPPGQAVSDPAKNG